MEKTIEILEKTIKEQESKIEGLESTIESYERHKNWAVHRFIDEQKIASTIKGYDKLPLPRLEMRINPLQDDWGRVEWIYGLVYKHVGDYIVFIPYGQTIGTGGYQGLKDKIELPHRDGLHFLTESKLFDIPAYVSCDGRISEADFSIYPDGHYDKMISEMKRD